MFPLKDNLRCLKFPLATLILIAINLFAYLYEVMQIGAGTADSFFGTWLMVPAKVIAAFTGGDPSAIGHVILTVFASMFLHGGLMHLVGNMVFFFVFGKAVEARLGTLRYVGFYLLFGVLAAVAHILSDPTSMIPTLGASGAVAGVLGAYLVLWPKADITGLIVLLPVRARAYWFLLFWFGSQLFSIVTTMNDPTGGGVAYWAHVGGFVAGFIIAGIVKLIKPVSDVCYIPTEHECTPCEHEDGQDDGKNGNPNDEQK